MFKRNLNIDLIKILAMIFVIGLHTCTSYYIGSFNINAYFAITVCGTAIPLFFTVSGYLLLGRKNIDWSYSLKKIWGIVRFVFVVCWIYWLIMLIISPEPHWDKLYKDPLGAFLMGGTFWQFWYFGAMNIIYFVYPLLNKVYNEKYKLFFLIFVLIVIVCAVIHILNIITPGTFEAKLSQSLRIWNWLMYFCLGGIIKHYRYEENIKIGLVFGMSIAYFMLLFFVHHLNKTMLKSDYNFSSPITLLYVYCLFSYLNNLNVARWKRQIDLLSSLFLPVYTIHPILIINSVEIRDKLNCFPIYWMLISFVTIFISYLIMQVKFGRWIFRI